MEGNALPPENSNRSPNSTDKKAVKGFTLLKMGVLEILFVGVVLFLFFGVLNYFNILSVSSAFPEQLGWLPRQTASQQKLLYTPALPTSTVTSQEENARKVLFNVLSQNLASSALPSIEEVKITPSNAEADAFDSIWKNKDFTVSSRLKLSPNKQYLSYLMLSMELSDEATLSSNFSERIASNFFSIVPKSTWDCKTVNNLASCENFWQEQDGAKKGIALHGPITTSEDKKIIYLSFCEFSKESPQNKLDSCFR